MTAFSIPKSVYVILEKHGLLRFPKLNFANLVTIEILEIYVLIKVDFASSGYFHVTRDEEFSILKRIKKLSNIFLVPVLHNYIYIDFYVYSLTAERTLALTIQNEDFMRLVRIF